MLLLFFAVFATDAFPKISVAQQDGHDWLANATHVEPGTGDQQANYRIATDVPYREGELSGYMQERCRLDVYFPADKEDFATVVWFHGGGLTSGGKFIPDELKNCGIAVVAVNYRLSPQVSSPGYVEDAAAAVAWTINNIHSCGGSTSKIFVSGHSAGGYLTSMVGMDSRWLAAHEIETDQIAGLIPFSGHMITHFTVRNERGIPKEQPTIDDMAPLFHVRNDAPPMLIITGDRDLEMLGRYEESAYFLRMMEHVGHDDVDLIELEGYNHGEMAGPAFPLLLKFIESISGG